MKGVLQGLKELQRLADESNRPKSNFIKIEDGQSATVRFLQELDEDGKFYDESRGKAIALFEHTNPDDYSQRFLCTAEEEGKCVGCERVVINPKWKKRSRLLTSVFVKEDNEVKIIGTGFSPKGIGSELIEFATDFGTICDRDYKLKRTGSKLKTSYSLFPREPGKFDFNKVTLPDLSPLARYRTYDECLVFLKGEADSGGWD